VSYINNAKEEKNKMPRNNKESNNAEERKKMCAVDDPKEKMRT
jgi:hypothetical protein